MIQANPKKTLAPFVGVVIAALLLWVWEPDNKKGKSYFENYDLVFGTYYNIRYEAKRDLQAEINEALKDFDNSLSMFNPHSILSAINDNRDTTTNEAFESMWYEAAKVYEISHGAFDITVAPLVNYWGFGSTKTPNHQEAANSSDLDEILEFVGFEKVQLIDHQVIKEDPRIMIDAGAVAKGQACDMIAQVLQEQGCTNYLVEIGGEVVAHGVNAKGKPWTIGITKPNLNNEGIQEGYQDTLRLTDACLATSGNYRNYYYEGTERRSHTIDPRTGWPVQHSLLSATVISSSCMQADALATACMVLGADDALDMIANVEGTACYLIIAENDSLAVLTSPNWDDFTTK